MIQLLLVGLAAWMTYEVIRAVVPVPPAIQPILVVAACYGLSHAPPEVLAALDAAAVAALVRVAVSLVLPQETPQMLRMPRRAQKPSRLPEMP